MRLSNVNLTLYQYIRLQTSFFEANLISNKMHSFSFFLHLVIIFCRPLLFVAVRSFFFKAMFVGQQNTCFEDFHTMSPADMERNLITGLQILKPTMCTTSMASIIELCCASGRTSLYKSFMSGFSRVPSFFSYSKIIY